MLSILPIVVLSSSHILIIIIDGLSCLPSYHQIHENELIQWKKGINLASS